MYPADARSKWRGDLVTDPRVTHRWDEAKVVGTWFGARKSMLEPRLSPDSQGTGGEILWDSYLLYSEAARWDDMPRGLIRWGRTIVAGRETLRQDVEQLFGQLPRSR